MAVKSAGGFEALLRNGWDINQPLGRTDPPALASAFILLQRCSSLIYHGYIDDEKLVRWFILHGADPNATCDWDLTPLSPTVSDAPLCRIKYFLRVGKSIERGQLLHYAVLRKAPDWTEVLTLLLDKGASINQIKYEDRPRTFWERSPFGLGTPLHKAAELGRADIVSFPLKRGADRTIKDTKGETALEIAERHGNTEVIELLCGSWLSKIWSKWVSGLV